MRACTQGGACRGAGEGAGWRVGGWAGAPGWCDAAPCWVGGWVGGLDWAQQQLTLCRPDTRLCSPLLPLCSPRIRPAAPRLGTLLLLLLQVLEHMAVGDEPPPLEEFNDLTLPSPELMGAPGVAQAIQGLKVRCGAAALLAGGMAMW